LRPFKGPLRSIYTLFDWNNSKYLLVTFQCEIEASNVRAENSFCEEKGKKVI